MTVFHKYECWKRPNRRLVLFIDSQACSSVYIYLHALKPKLSHLTFLLCDVYLGIQVVVAKIGVLFPGRFCLLMASFCILICFYTYHRLIRIICNNQKSSFLSTCVHNKVKIGICVLVCFNRGFISKQHMVDSPTFRVKCWNTCSELQRRYRMLVFVFFLASMHLEELQSTDADDKVLENNEMHHLNQMFLTCVKKTWVHSV